MATQLTSMFGIDPAAYQTQQQNTEFAQDVARMQLTPLQRSEMAILQGARGFGRAVGGMMGLQDPQMAKASMAQQLASKYDLTNPDQIDKLAQELNQNGAPDLAAIAVDKANKIRESRAEVTQRTTVKPPAIGERVNQQLFAGFQRQAQQMGATTPEQIDAVAAQLYDKYETDKKVKVSAAGAIPAPGQVPLTTIKQAQDIVSDYIKDPEEKLKKIKVISLTGQGVKNNPSLLPTFQKEVAGFVKDSQISNADFNRALGSSGIAADAIDGVNKFFTGAPTNAKIDDILKGWKVVEGIYADQYNTGLTKAANVLEQGKIAPETQKAILPKRYNTTPKVTAPAVGVVKNGYRFKGGDPSKQANWEAVQ